MAYDAIAVRRHRPPGQPDRHQSGTGLRGRRPVSRRRGDAMSTAARSDVPARDVRFRADVAWLGPILGAPDERGQHSDRGRRGPGARQVLRGVARSRHRTRRAFQRRGSRNLVARCVLGCLWLVHRVTAGGSVAARRRGRAPGPRLQPVARPRVLHVSRLRPHAASRTGSGNAGERTAARAAAHRRTHAGRCEAAHRRLRSHRRSRSC